MIKEVEVKDPKYWKGFRKNRTYEGRCFERAFKYILDSVGVRDDNDTLKLIHGTTDYFHNGNVRAHGWVEFSVEDVEIVFDAITQKFYDKKDYYEKTGAVMEKEYSIKEACIMVSKTGHCGVWHESNG